MIHNFKVVGYGCRHFILRWMGLQRQSLSLWVLCPIRGGLFFSSFFCEAIFFFSDLWKCGCSEHRPWAVRAAFVFLARSEPCGKRAGESHSAFSLHVPWQPLARPCTDPGLSQGAMHAPGPAAAEQLSLVSLPWLEVIAPACVCARNMGKPEMLKYLKLGGFHVIFFPCLKL